jgi:hypothetical protein
MSKIQSTRLLLLFFVAGTLYPAGGLNAAIFDRNLNYATWPGEVSDIINNILQIYNKSHASGNTRDLNCLSQNSNSTGLKVTIDFRLVPSFSAGSHLSLAS